MLASLDVCMGGRVAEELIFGDSEVTSGASSDFEQATSMARAMVTQYGMSKQVGLVSYNYEDDGKAMSSETRLLIEEEVKNFLERAYNNAKTILTEHNKELHTLANALLEHETLSGAQIKNLLAQADTSQPQEHAVEAPQKTPASPRPQLQLRQLRLQRQHNKRQHKQQVLPVSGLSTGTSTGLHCVHSQN